MASTRCPEAGRAALLISRRLRHWHGEWRPAEAPSLRQVELLRRMLEESGFHCEDSDQLQELAAFLISSPRGTEMVLSSRLSESERLAAYVHLLAHALIGRDRGRLLARFEYPPGREPAHLSGRERREGTVAHSLARAILAGRLEAAPRYLYGEERRGAGEGFRKGPRHVLLVLLHYLSEALYWRSTSYQHLRSWPAVAGLVSRFGTLLGEAEPVAA